MTHPGAPVSPASRYPLREPAFTVGNTVGWDEQRVVAALGKPDSRERGRYWLARDGGVPPHVERGADGTLRRAAVFGPLPCTIEPGVPYEVWLYCNVRGQTWALYLSAGEAGKRTVVETTAYPTGAVF
jgi:hypothetical protein